MQHQSQVVALRILYIALLSGMIAFCAVAFILYKGGSFSAEPGISGKTLQIICLFVAAASISISKLLFNKAIGKIQILTEVSSKLKAYRSAAILTYALLEVPVLIATSCYLLTGDSKILIIALIMLGYFLTWFPSARKIGSHINEQPEVISQL